MNIHSLHSIREEFEFKNVDKKLNINLQMIVVYYIFYAYELHRWVKTIVLLVDFSWFVPEPVVSVVVQIF